MKVEAVSDAHKRDDTSAVESLESRLLRASQELTGSKRPDPEFDWLYQQLLAMEGQGEKNIYEFIRSQRSADGITPAFATGKALMAVTLQVLTRLKEEKLEGSLLFKEVSGANSLAFNLDLFVKSFMREVFATKDDDAWEKSEW
jgi:5'-3' exonuclease